MWSKTKCYGVLLALAFQQSPKPADTFVEVDFAKIDRTLLKEPKYVAEPRYALFVLDPAGRFACWAAFDRSTADSISVMSERFLDLDRDELSVTLVLQTSSGAEKQIRVPIHEHC